MARRLWLLAFGLLLTAALAPPLLTRGMPTYNSQPLSLAAFAALGDREGWSADWVEAGPEVALAGLVRPAATRDARWLLFLPGNGEEQLAKGQDYLDRLAPDDGWGLAVFALRGYDASGGHPGPRDLIADTARVHEHLRLRYGARTERTFLVGFSFGTGLALHLGATLARAGTPPPGIVLLSTQGTELRWWMRKRGFAGHWRLPDLWDVTSLVPDLTMPFLIIESRDDLRGPQELRHLLGDRVQYLELAAGGHLAPLGDPDAIATTRDFITAHATMAEAGP